MHETAEDSTAMTLNSKISSIDQNITSYSGYYCFIYKPFKRYFTQLVALIFCFLFFYFLFSFFISCFPLTSLTIFIVSFLFLFIFQTFFSRFPQDMRVSVPLLFYFKINQFHYKNQQPQSQHLSQSHWLA